MFGILVDTFLVWILLLKGIVGTSLVALRYRYWQDGRENWENVYLERLFAPLEEAMMLDDAIVDDITKCWSQDW